MNKTDRLNELFKHRDDGKFAERITSVWEDLYAVLSAADQFCSLPPNSAGEQEAIEELCAATSVFSQWGFIEDER